MASHPQRLSRRGFTQIVGLAVTSLGLKPTLATAGLMLDSTLGADSSESPVVRLGSNESAYGPSPAVFDAMKSALTRICQYPKGEEAALIADLADHHGVDTDCILLTNGSSEALSLCVAAFAGPERPVVMADPTFEAVSCYAQSAKANVLKSPLTADYRHNLDSMLRPRAGLIYICNPNNPTGTITPELEILTFLARAPIKTAVVIDEAYIHYSENSVHASVASKIKTYPNLIVARTFSKIYGLAGLRCGYTIAQPATIKLLRAQQSWNSLNIMALVAARFSLKDNKHVKMVRRQNYNTKMFTLARLEAMGYHALPSETNFLMVDLRQDVESVINSLRRHRVEVGPRLMQMPNFLRVTIGTLPQMQTFLSALEATLT